MARSSPSRPTAADTEQRKAWLRDYFNGVGFDRWQAIYGDGELSGVRLTVREGHRQMLSTLLQWLDERALPPGSTAFDAGCGTGLLSLALAQRGHRVTAVDIAPQMIREATRQAMQISLAGKIDFLVADLEAVTGNYDLVACLDVLIHYPRPAFVQLCRHLASLTRDRLFITFAPHNPALSLLHHIGAAFPKSQRRTDIQMIPGQVVQQTLEEAGLQVVRTERISRGFYHVELVEARR